MKKIGIIGGGASGVLTALHCWKKFQNNCQIYIFDPAKQLGLGKAYSTDSTNYILNVPASEMRIYTDQSDNFEQWVLQANPTLINSPHWPFVPRFYFGQYLQEHLQKIPQKILHHVQHKVTNVSTQRNSYSLVLDNSETHSIDYLVIATGFTPKGSALKFHTTQASNSQIFESEQLKGLKSSNFNGHVAIVGTGLTAVDIWRQLHENKLLSFSLLSRHGFLPHAKNAQRQNSKIKLPQLYGMSPLQIFQILRIIQQVHGIDWGVLADHLQGQAQKIWTCWTPKERETFLKYLKPYWEVIRHRMPDSVSSELNKNISDSNTQIHAGQIQSIKETSENITILYTERASKQLKTLTCNHLIFAIGPKIETNLIKNNQFAGVYQCPYGFGYINTASPRLWFVGPASKGTYFEITSIPYIRTQANMIANEMESLNVDKRHLQVEKFHVHPTAAKETYFEHLQQAMSFARKLLKLAMCAFVHALFPFAYVDTTSECLRDLSAILAKRRLRTTHANIMPIQPFSPTYQNHEACLDHQNHQQRCH